MELKNQILKALGLSEEKEVTLEFQTKLEDGTIIVSSADSLTAGVDISVLTEDGTTIPLPIGDYRTDEGLGFSVVEEGVVSEILEEETEEETEEVEEEEIEASEETVEEVVEPSEVEEARHPKKIKTTEEIEFTKDELMTEITNVVTELLSDVQGKVSELSSEMETLKGYKETLEEETIELQKEVVKLSSEPATTPVDTNKFSSDKKLTKIEYNKLDGKERFLYNLNNN